MKAFFTLQTLFLVISVALPLSAREWSDISGHYHFHGELIAGDDSMVVLEKENKDLVAIDVDQLSKKDQTFLADAAEQAAANPALKTWTTRRGVKVRAAVVEFVSRDVAIRRVRGKAYVNDKRFANMPGVYRKIVPAVISHFEGIELDEHGVEKWVKNLGGKKAKYSCEGVLLELENGDHYAVPFFCFGDADLEILKPGFDKWSLAANSERDREHYSMSMRAQSMAKQQQKNKIRQVARLHLQLEEYEAGLIDLWEVALLPPPNVRAMPMRVVVPGRNSQQAKVAALAKYPRYRVGPLRKVRSKSI